MRAIGPHAYLIGDASSTGFDEPFNAPVTFWPVATDTLGATDAAERDDQATRSSAGSSNAAFRTSSSRIRQRRCSTPGPGRCRCSCSPTSLLGLNALDLRELDAGRRTSPRLRRSSSMLLATWAIVEPPPRQARVRPTDADRAGRAGAVPGRADAPGAGVRPVRRCAPRRWPSASDPAAADLPLVVVRRRRTAALGRSPIRRAAHRARTAGRPGAAAAAAVHHVPVHQRRGLGDGRHARRRGVRRGRAHVLPARRGFVRQPGARLHPRARTASTRGRRSPTTSPTRRPARSKLPSGGPTLDPLRPRQRFNIGLIVLFGQALQITLVVVALIGFFVFFGFMAIDGRHDPQLDRARRASTSSPRRRSAGERWCSRSR